MQYEDLKLAFLDDRKLYLVNKKDESMKFEVTNRRALVNNKILDIEKKKALAHFSQALEKSKETLEKSKVDVKELDLESMTKDELIKIAVKMDIDWSSKDTIADLIEKINGVEQ